MSAIQLVCSLWLVVCRKKQILQTTNRRGFTLIELMIAISIVAIISTVGLVTYSRAQVLGRDAKRKQDLRSIAIALELYYQTNKRFPCPGDNAWAYSNASDNWVLDTDFAGCGDTSQKNLVSTYINQLPKDPVNTASCTPWSGSSCYAYGFRGYFSSFCNNKRGQFYILMAQLENKNDPDRNAIKQVADCNGVPILTGNGTGWDTAFVLTSN